MRRRCADESRYQPSLEVADILPGLKNKMIRRAWRSRPSFAEAG